MTIVAMPASVRVQRVRWQLDRPAQVNRSAYTGARRVVANPWHGKWSASAEIVPIVGEANVRAWRAFLASLKGQINTFQLPATEGPQYVGSNPTAGASAAQGATSITLSSTITFPGANLVGDPGFDSAVFWTGATGGWSVSGSKAVGTAVNGYLFKSAATVVGVYQYSFDIVTRSAGSVRCYEGTTAVFSGSGSAVGTFTGTFTASTGGEYGLNSNDGFTGTVDNFSLKLGTVSGVPPLTAGMMVTVTLPSGNKQLVMLTADVTVGGVITFEPPLREAISSGAAIEALSPYALVALADSSFGWSVDPGTLYGISFNADEAF